MKFWENVDVRGKNDCWPWIGRKNKKGYGVLCVGRRDVGAHRISWEVNRGKIPPGDGYHGTCVLHKCDTPVCVNPDHLFLGTNEENLKDMAKKKRSLIGELNKNNRLTETQAREIKFSKEQTCHLAKRYGITDGHVRNIRGGRNWKYL